MPGALITIEEINARVQALENELATLQAQLRSNTAVTNQIKKDTSELIALFNTYTTAMRMGMKFTLTLGRLMQWIAGIIIAGGIIYTAWNNIKFGIFIPGNK